MKEKTLYSLVSTLINSGFNVDSIIEMLEYNVKADEENAEQIIRVIDYIIDNFNY